MIASHMIKERPGGGGVKYCVEHFCYPLSTGLPKQDSGHWWSSFFFGKQVQMGTLAEENQQK